MWVIARNDPEELMPEVLTDEEGAVIIFADKVTAWRYMETLCYDNGVPTSFLDFSDITLHRLH